MLSAAEAAEALDRLASAAKRRSLAGWPALRWDAHTCQARRAALELSPVAEVACATTALRARRRPRVEAEDLHVDGAATPAWRTFIVLSTTAAALSSTTNPLRRVECRPRLAGRPRMHLVPSAMSRRHSWLCALTPRGRPSIPRPRGEPTRLRITEYISCRGAPSGRVRAMSCIESYRSCSHALVASHLQLACFARNCCIVPASPTSLAMGSPTSLATASLVPAVSPAFGTCSTRTATAIRCRSPAFAIAQLLFACFARNCSAAPPPGGGSKL